MNFEHAASAEMYWYQMIEELFTYEQKNERGNK